MRHRKNFSFREDTVSREPGSTTQLAAMAHTALKEGFELKEACGKIHIRTRAHQPTDLCTRSCPGCTPLLRWGGKVRIVGSCISTLGFRGMGSSRPWDRTPVSVTYACAPLPRSPDTWVTQDTASLWDCTAQSACTGRDISFSNLFLKNTVFHVSNVVMILKDKHLELKPQPLCGQVLAKALQIITFPASLQPFKAHCSIPPDDGKNRAPSCLKSCLHFRRAHFFHSISTLLTDGRLCDRCNAQRHLSKVVYLPTNV